jgi:hypothetical protein
MDMFRGIATDTWRNHLHTLYSLTGWCIYDIKTGSLSKAFHLGRSFEDTISHIVGYSNANFLYTPSKYCCQCKTDNLEGIRGR